jgi:hypothetical protein
MSSKIYDILKYVGRIVLPAIATLYATIAKIWNLPYMAEIPATIMAIDVFLNAILEISSANYKVETAGKVK